jgi:hypothetical protein
MSLMLLACVFSTFAMTGLIWLIQVVTYPLMSLVPEDRFVDYEAAHRRNITPLVLPLMTCELLTSAWLSFVPIPTVRAELIGGGVLTVLLWLSTFLIQVPLHSRLAVGFIREDWRRLVMTNWIRTVLWTGRSLLMAWVVWRITAHE